MAQDLSKRFTNASCRTLGSGSMIRIKTEEEIALLREGGHRLAQAVLETGKLIAPGVSIQTLNDHVESLVRAGGYTPSFLNYKPRGAKRPFPAALCLSVNDEAVHGIPTEDPHIIEN